MDKYQLYVLAQISLQARKTGCPVHAIPDDTISEKTKPSSKALRPTEGCSFHHSHLRKKRVYVHQYYEGGPRLGQKVNAYVKTLTKKDVRLVTVGNQIRNEIKQNLIAYVYEQACHGIPLSKVSEELGIAV